MRQLPWLGLFCLLWGCGEIAEHTEERLIADIPSALALADSLNAAHAKSIKWVIEGDHVVSGIPQEPDWKKELETIISDNVNHLRYRDAFTVSDSTVGERRTVVFRANNESQEIRLVKLILDRGRIIYYLLEKSKSNMYSSSSARFEFTSGHYSLSAKQSIAGLLNTEQHLYALVFVGGDLWHGDLKMSGAQLPVQFVFRGGSEPYFAIRNADETVLFSRYEARGDSMYFGSSFFNTAFVLAPTSDTTMQGYWLNAKTESPYRLSFSANKNNTWRFACSAMPTQDLSGTYGFTFNTLGATDTAKLKLSQRQNVLTGTLLTETGDFRYLDGSVCGDSLFMSALDGSNSYLFKGVISNGVLSGQFWSGRSAPISWSASISSNYILGNPEKLTVPTSDRFDFRFADSTGKVVSLSDPSFENKPMLVSVGASWCSNCMDEAAFLSEVYKVYNPKGLQVLMLSFELVSDSISAWRNIARFTRGVKMPYPALLAGLRSTKSSASEALGGMSQLVSYPTLLALDRDHNIVNIHTGFSGPATGLEYEKFRGRYLQLCDSLIQSP